MHNNPLVVVFLKVFLKKKISPFLSNKVAALKLNVDFFYPHYDRI